ncbi:hypothetical protein N7454_010874 [Penicillium verhagenii]|nr:hypothetical protein N7454_010874 [Penicillium verhagenii]
MSFLDSVLTSLQTGKLTELPTSQPPSPPKNPSPKPDDRKPASAPRKAEEQLPRSTKPDSRPVATPRAPKPTLKSTPVKTVAPKVAPKNGTVGVKRTTAAPTKSASTKPAPPDSGPSKAPPKGSYADLMAQAKARQEQAPSHVGLIRNQTDTREHIGQYKLKQRMQEAKMRAKMEAKGKKFTPETVRTYGRKRSPEHPTRKRSPPEGPSYKGTAKPTQTPEPPAYHGTAGLPGKTGNNDRRQHGKRRMNEYMGTDEEDEGDYGGYNDYYSDVSSDMEAGFDDVEEEEGTALKNARREDEKELRLEMAAKKEKLERQQRLAALASRKR